MAATSEPEPGSTKPKRRRGRGKPFTKDDPRRNVSGRPRKLVEIERMLDAEHRTVDNMREVFARLKALACGETVLVRDDEGNVLGARIEAHPGFMKLYLERVIGPVREVEELDLTNAPPEAIEFLRGLRLVN